MKEPFSPSVSNGARVEEASLRIRCFCKLAAAGGECIFLGAALAKEEGREKTVSLFRRASERSETF